MIKYKNYIKTLDINKINILSDNVDGRYHYVYRITNLIENKYYYGSRSTKILPNLELGIKYFSSIVSKKNKWIIEDQKINKQNYKYKILKVFNNAKDKMLYESYIHYIFDVKTHNKFYNSSNQTPNGFDRTGVKVGEEIILKQKISQNTIEWANKIKYKCYLRFNDANWLASSFAEGIAKMKLTKNSKEWKESVGIESSLKMVNTKKLNGTDSSGNRNPRAKKINIYNDKGELMFECHGNFKEVCAENKLPFKQLKLSYQNNGNKIYQSDINVHSRMNEWHQFKSWFAKIINQ